MKPRTSLALLVFAAFVAAPSPGIADDGCHGWGTENVWDGAGEFGDVTLVTSGVEAGIVERFEDDVSDALATMDGFVDIAGPVVVCAFVDLEDQGGLTPDNQALHAAVLTSERIVLLDAEQVALFRPAVAIGLSYLGMWDLAQSQGAVGYPEPLRDAVSQWFAAQLTGRLDLHRDTMRRVVAFSKPEEDTTTRRWTYAAQEPTFVWNPEYQEAPTGDLVAFAVAEHGSEVLADTSAETWDAIDTEWRVARRFELLGDQRNAVSWRWGLAIAIAAIVLALLLAYIQRVVRRRDRYTRGDTSVVPGLFDD